MNTNLNISAQVAKYHLMSQTFAFISKYMFLHVSSGKNVSAKTYVLRNSKQLVGGFNPSEKI